MLPKARTLRHGMHVKDTWKLTEVVRKSDGSLHGHVARLYQRGARELSSRCDTFDKFHIIKLANE